MLLPERASSFDAALAVVTRKLKRGVPIPDIEDWIDDQTCLTQDARSALTFVLNGDTGKRAARRVVVMSPIIGNDFD